MIEHQDHLQLQMPELNVEILSIELLTLESCVEPTCGCLATKLSGH